MDFDYRLLAKYLTDMLSPEEMKLDGNTALHVKCQVRMRENRQAPEGQNGQIPSGQFHVLVPF